MDTTEPAIVTFDGTHRWLSNFWSAPVEFEGDEYPTVEHAYQAAKTLDRFQRAEIQELKTAGQAKRAGKTLTLRPDWENVRLGIMLDLIRQKFTKHPTLKQLLLDTGERQLIEGNQWNDTFWGVCRGKGENHLGKILMQVRAELRAAEPTPELGKPKSTKKRNLRVLVCGGRDFALDPEYLRRATFANPHGQRQAIERATKERQQLFEALDRLHELRVIDVVITGAARGADRAAIAWADQNGIPHPEWPISDQDWTRHGKKAGYLRNMAMLKEGKPDVVVAFPGGAGTTMMIGLAQTAGVPIWEPLKPKSRG